MNDENCKLWIIDKSNNQLFQNLLFTINKNPDLIYKERKKVMDTYIKSLLNASRHKTNNNNNSNSTPSDQDLSTTNLY
jgi:hypothetical protein